MGPEAVLNALADTQRELSRVPAAFTRISDDEEISIGNTLAERYAQQYGPGDATMQAYVNTVGRKVAGRARRKFDYKFHYVADESLVNAFALPGGHVFIGKGMVRLMKTEDELASVLGHEVEHIDNYHCVERYQLKARMHDLPLAELLALPVELFQAGYGKEQELEADRDGTYLAVMAGYSPQGAIHLFERFGRLHHEQVSQPQSPDEELSKVAIAGIEGYFRSHPLPEERINQIQRLVAAKKMGQPAGESLACSSRTPANNRRQSLNRNDTQRAIKLRHLEHNAVFHHSLHAPDIADMRGRIAIDQDYVSELARSDGAEFGIALDHARCSQRGQLQHFRRGNAGFLIKLEFAMEGKAGIGVRSGNNGNAGIIKHLGHIEHVLE